MEERKIRVAITHGDTNGIGYEVILKAFEDPGMLELCTPIIYGSPKAATYHRNALHLETPFSVISKAEDAREGRLNLLAAFEEEVKVELGTPTPESAEAARKALQRAKEDLKAGAYDVLVQAPVVASNTPDREDRSLLVMFSDDIRIALATNRLPIKEVAQSITQDSIVAKGKLFHTCLKRDFRIQNPRIAVLALNPQPGTEEKDIILPAIDTLMAAGIKAFGPYSAERFLGSDMLQRFDCVLAMTSEQRKTVFEALAVEPSVVYEAGLGIVAVTPLIDVVDAVAHRGELTPDDLRQALYTAVDIFRNRCSYDEPMQHPLPKLYHEKRDDSEKVRFRSHNA
jgi:4-hydroxythreonine-4-phosphate dehydrogenase